MEGVTAHERAVIVEVLSPSSRITDFTVKFRDYTALPTLQTYVIVDPDRPDVVVYTRTPEDRWEVAVASGLEASVTLSGLGVALPLAEIYDRVTFDAVSATG
jgi:Uma2 family endonuclease